ncbi:MAG: TlpA disulfide reductase family protein [Anaerolineae bacterium]
MNRYQQMYKSIRVILLLAGLLLAGCGSQPRVSAELAAAGLANLAEISTTNINNSQTGLKTGDVAPDFNLQFADGNKARLSDYKGHPVIINFWATWCPPCREEMPGFVNVYNRYKADDVLVIGVNAEETAAEAADFVRSYQMTFPVALDERGELMQLYNVRGLPTTVFIDKEGHIAGIWSGLLPENELEVSLAELK